LKGSFSSIAIERSTFVDIIAVEVVNVELVLVLEEEIGGGGGPVPSGGGGGGGAVTVVLLFSSREG
jgi:hypothetical protein